MLLLLFLLLLALGNLLVQRTKEVGNLRVELNTAKSEKEQLRAALRRLEVIEEFLRKAPNSSPEAAIQDLAAKILRAETLDQRVAELGRQNSKLAEEVRKLKAELASEVAKAQGLADILLQAAEIDPEDPPAVLRKSIELIKAVGKDVSLDELKKTSELAKENTMLLEKLSEAQINMEQIRKERDNLMNQGGGTTYPSCWITADGKTEFIFDVTIRDTGMVIRDVFPASRASDSAWQLVGNFPRNVEISSGTFRNATVRLFEWSQENRCRFFVNLRDGTGATSKAPYKRFRTLVEGHFYIRLVNAAP
jgi:hypothetical protein